ncbi:MAG: hypothetical protein H0V19_07580, partial [Euzebyales bacterium]|nr:hypothetical protein [Euzebyales bacterium]
MTRSVLNPDHPYKPLDVGNGVVAASVDAAGRLLSVGGYHVEAGYVTLEGASPFPHARRHDPAAVRRYRAALAAPGAPGFGLAPAGGWDQVGARQ